MDDLYLPVRVRGNGHIGPMLLMNVFQRLQAGIFGKGEASKPLIAAAWIDASYCIDALETMPAGSCQNYEMQKDLVIIEQTTFARQS